MALQTRFVATAARLPSVAASHLQNFPPHSSLYQNSDIPNPSFDPQAWAAAQPPPPSALVAFAHRLGLASVLSSPDLVQQACTHPSFFSLHQKFHPDASRPQTNAQLAPLGNSLMGMFASEFVHAAYPYLPTRVWKAAVTAYVGPATCATVAQEMGASPLVRWHRTVCLYLTPTFSSSFSLFFTATIRNTTPSHAFRRPGLGSSLHHSPHLPTPLPPFCSPVCPLLLPQPSNRPSEYDQIR